MQSLLVACDIVLYIDFTVQFVYHNCVQYYNKCLCLRLELIYLLGIRSKTYRLTTHAGKRGM